MYKDIHESKLFMDLDYYGTDIFMDLRYICI